MAIETYFKDIADAIREKAGTSGLITPAQMPAAIRAIPTTPFTYQVTVTGGYNGGAVISVKFNGATEFTSTGDSPYNLSYSPSSGSVQTVKGTVLIAITPPSSSSGKLVINLSGGVTFSTGEISPDGANTSYGYSYDSGIIKE